MSYLPKYKKYKMKYIHLRSQIEQKGGYIMHGPTVTKYNLLGQSWDEDFNSNVLKINYNDISKNIIISTGHSASNSDTLRLFRTSYEKSTLKDTLETSNKFYVVNDDTDNKKDYCVFFSEEINSAEMKIIIHDKQYIVNGLERKINPEVEYVKNGKTTGVTYGKLLLDLTAEETLTKIEDSKKDILEYTLENGNKMFIYSSKIYKNFCDYILCPSDKYYADRTIDPDVKPKDRFYSILRDLKTLFPTSTILKDEKATQRLLNDNGDISQKYYDMKKFGWLSNMGDSGSGYYNLNEDKAKLLGLNISGCSVIILKEIEENNPELVWDIEMNRLKIANYSIEELYKCSCILNINSIEKFMKEEIGEENTISFIDEF
jgi:hypothetical protein